MQNKERIKSLDSFTLFRSNGFPVNKYTTVEELEIRPGEYIKEVRTTLLPIEIYWLDEKKQKQHKSVNIHPECNPKEAVDFIQCELGIDIRFELTTEEALVSNFNNMKDLLDEMNGNRFFLRRESQKSWDDTEFEETYRDTRVVTILKPDELAITNTAVDQITFMDIAESIADQHPEYKGRVIVDENGVAYGLSERPFWDVPRGVTLITSLSPKKLYTQEEIEKAISEIALNEETTPDSITRKVRTYQPPLPMRVIILECKRACRPQKG